jgi:hypothetical protein
MNPLDKALRFIVVLPGLLFVTMGLRWVIAPEGVAKELGMPLLEGMARSSQIGDIGAFFISGGIMALLGALTLQRTWFLAAAIMVAAVALFRTLAWLFHDAAFATQSIAVEVVVLAIVLAAAVRIGKA